MAHGKNAQKNGRCGREYWSRRPGSGNSWGPIAKQITHEKERAEAKQELHKIKKDVNKD